MHEIPLPLLILQHPQEPSRKDGEVSSAKILAQNISPCLIKTGLSWRNLTHVLRGWKEIESSEELLKPSSWYTLYLGTQKNTASASPSLPGIYFLDRKGNPIDAPRKPEIGGLILLDGTWAQAKTLWWRNPWLLKTHRIYIVPKSRSLYGNIRKEPRPECVSTLEAASETLQFLGLEEEIGRALKGEFKKQLEQYLKKTTPTRK
ncbi:DTW domain-containing protein [bacterium]|nr:DTW domain-containing protein [bacterium]